MMYYVVVEVKNVQYSAGSNRPDLRITENDYPLLSFADAMQQMKTRNAAVEKNQPYAYAVMPAAVWFYIVNSVMMNEEKS